MSSICTIIQWSKKFPGLSIILHHLSAQFGFWFNYFFQYLPLDRISSSFYFESIYKESPYLLISNKQQNIINQNWMCRLTRLQTKNPTIDFHTKVKWLTTNNNVIKIRIRNLSRYIQHTFERCLDAIMNNYHF